MPAKKIKIRKKDENTLFTIFLLLALIAFTIISSSVVSQSNSAHVANAVSANADDSFVPVQKPTAASTTAAEIQPFSAPSLVSGGKRDLSLDGKKDGAAITTPNKTTTTAAKQDSAHPERKYYLTVTSEVANLRTGPGTDFDIVRKAYEGDKLYLMAVEYAENGGLWYKVFADDTTDEAAYISGNYIHYTGPIPGGKAYLTFDDGPSSQTIKILDILDEYDAKATFFVIYSSKYKDLYKEIIDRGHTIALHSYTHDYKTIYSSEDAYFKDLTKLSDYVYEQCGVRSNIIRFPGGGSNTVSRKYCSGIMSRLANDVHERGYKYYDWNASSGDAEGNHIAASKLVANTKRETGNRPSVMLLLHDAEAKDTTAQALPEICEFYKSRGYKMVGIDENTEEVHHKVNN